MYYLLKSENIDIDTYYHISADGIGVLTELPRTARHYVCHIECPADTKIYAVIGGKVAYDVWPKNNEKRYRTEFRRLRGYWPCTVGNLVAKSESQPDFEFI